jgi:hypothetical protein
VKSFPDGWFIFVSATGARSVAFHCARCHAYSTHGITTGVFHCGRFENVPTAPAPGALDRLLGRTPVAQPLPEYRYTSSDPLAAAGLFDTWENSNAQETEYETFNPAGI